MTPLYLIGPDRRAVSHPGEPRLEADPYLEPVGEKPDAPLDGVEVVVCYGGRALDVSADAGYEFGGDAKALMDACVDVARRLKLRVLEKRNA